MKLTRNGIKNQELWEKAGIKLPGYDVEAVSEKAKKEPKWVHFGIGNIFRVFIGGIADGLLEEGALDRGITCVETFDYDVVEKIYEPYDNLGLSVILHGDGTREYKVLGSFAEAVKAQSSDPVQWKRLKEIFATPSLQMVSFTITEKGYALQKADGTWFPFVESDIKNGPDQAVGAMAVLTAMLYERYQAGKYPLALVSMDNCSQNGAKLRESVLTMTEEWQKAGFVDSGFAAYVSDEKAVSFPWTMIDKITPRPHESVQKALATDGWEGMDIQVTGKNTYIAPFVNTEKPQYLVIEDDFPAGRPPLEKAGVLFTSRDTVNAVERMKVCTCLNPLHTALAIFGCLLGHTSIAGEMADPDLRDFVTTMAYEEGMPVVIDPGVIEPKAFLEEVLTQRFPNPFIPDTPQRIATDTSQKLPIRFGVDIGLHLERGTAGQLQRMPLVLAGWLRYLKAVDDQGQPFTCSPDPLLEKVQPIAQAIPFGTQATQEDFGSLLEDASIWGVDLKAAGLSALVVEDFNRLNQGPGAVRTTLEQLRKG